MKNSDMAMLVVVLVAIAGLMGYREYEGLKQRIEVTQRKIDSVADESSKTIATLRDAINDLRKVFREETQRLEQSIAKQVKDPVTDPPKQSVPTIVMHTDGNCGVCNNWWTHDRPSWERSGWTVEKLTEINGSRPYPWFSITNRDGSKFEVDGVLNRESFEAAKNEKLPLEYKLIDQLGLEPIKTTFESAPSTGPPPRVITWDLATQYKSGAYNGTFDFSTIDYALDVFGRYWNLDFQRVTRGGQYHVVQSARPPPTKDVAAWTNGSVTYISPIYNFQRSKALSGMVICHEWCHVRWPRHHSQDGGLMGPQGGYLFLPSDYPAMASFPWKGSLRPTDEPDFVRRYLSGNVVASPDVDMEKLFPLLMGCQTE